MKKIATWLVVFLFATLSQTAQILDPKHIEPHRFSEVITGIPVILQPSQEKRDGLGKLVEETYEITMKRITQHILPSVLKLNAT